MPCINYIKVFNQTLDEFFNELISIFPENNLIKVRYSLFQTIIKINVKKPCIEFMEGVLPYIEKIAMRDEEFLTSENTHPFIKQLNLNQTVIKELSDNTKQSIWRYIQLFITIGSKNVETPHEVHDIINYIINYN